MSPPGRSVTRRQFGFGVAAFLALGLGLVVIAGAFGGVGLAVVAGVEVLVIAGILRASTRA